MRTFREWLPQVLHSLPEFTALLTAGVMMAQEQSATQSSSTETKIDSKDNGKDVKSQTVTTNSASDSNGNASKDTTVTTTKSKKHHGKVKSTTTTDSTSTVAH